MMWGCLHYQTASTHHPSRKQEGRRPHAARPHIRRLNSICEGCSSSVAQAAAHDSHTLVHARFPELEDLAKAGTLVAWARPADYVERREAEGYQEPQLVLIVKTSHISRQSADDVTRVIETVRPDAVVVELCRSRSAVMAEPGQGRNRSRTTSTSSSGTRSSSSTSSSSSSSSSRHVDSLQPSAWAPASTSNDGQQSRSSPSAVMREPAAAGTGGDASSSHPPEEATLLGLLEVVRRSAQLGGQSGLLLLQLLLAGLSRRTATQAGGAGMQPGAEFLAARRAAERVDAQLVLGDRPVEITLQRAWDALSSQQQAALCWSLLRALVSPTRQAVSAELVEQVRRDEGGALSSLMGRMASTYPQLMEPLVHERDKYLAWSLKRSKAVNGARVVVGVIGAGHVPGVMRALAADNGGDTLRFSELVGNLNSRREQRARMLQAAGRLWWELVLGTAAYAAWTYWVPAGC